MENWTPISPWHYVTEASELERDGSGNVILPDGSIASMDAFQTMRDPEGEVMQWDLQRGLLHVTVLND